MKLGDIAKVAKGDWWVIPRYYEWVTKGRDLVKERETLVEIMTRPPRVRTNTFSASGAGRCQRERQLSFLGLKKKTPGEQTMNIFANGDYVHLRLQVAGLMGGWLEAAEVSVTHPLQRLTGTMDGVLSNGHGAEFKSINDRGFGEVAAHGPKAEHLLQTNSYMLASDLETFHIVYENKNTQDMKEFVVHRDEALIDQVQGDLAELNDATDARVMLPMLPECQEKKGRFNRCPYKESCPAAEFAESRSRASRIRIMSSSPSLSSE